MLKDVCVVWNKWIDGDHDRLTVVIDSQSDHVEC